MRFRILPLTLLCLIAVTPQGRAQQPAAIPVGTVAAEVRPITRSTDFVGRVEAPERVDIRARVTGFLQEVLFKEGDLVKEGDVLYKIEPETFQAAVQQAQGALVQAQATLANAAVNRARAQELLKTDTTSRMVFDQRVADEKNAQGAVVIADANLKTANVNLGYTEITAPISGEIGLSKSTKGNVVGPDSGPLTMIVSRDPMYVTFPVSQRIFLQIEGVERRNATDAVSVRIKFSDGTTYDQVGKVNFVNVTVDRATDTVIVRASVANPKGVLIDGQLVQVSVEAEKPVEKVLIPQTALIVDQQGPYVFLVVDGKAEVRRVKLGGESGPFAVIDDGLKGGEQVVVQGMESLRAGAAVIASPVPPPTAQG
jgi:membrane fusion protein, multidrug efflux system